MKANELRIGNWFLEKDEVKQFDGDFYHLLGCEPIPLNTNWLEKFGFKPWDEKKTIYTLERHIDKYNNTCFRFWLQLDKLVFDYIQNEIHPTESIFDDKNIIRLEINYVHQLQNLYFALTGEELTIKDTANG
jgi:hypothetical protein